MSFCACSPTTSNTICAPGWGRCSTTTPTAKPQRSPAARRKETTGRTEEGLPVQSFQSLLADLATYCRMQAATALNENYVFTLYSRPTQTQARAFELLGVKPDRTQ